MTEALKTASATPPSAAAVLSLLSDWLSARQRGLTDHEGQLHAQLSALDPALLATLARQAGQVDPRVQVFAAGMTRELAANAHKGPPGSWAVVAPEVLWADMAYHSAKLIYAVRHHEAQKVDGFAHDTANMCMMILDAYNAQAKREHRD